VDHAAQLRVNRKVRIFKKVARRPPYQPDRPKGESGIFGQNVAFLGRRAILGKAALVVHDH